MNGETRSKIARFNADGSLDPTFDPAAGAGAGSTDEIRALRLQSDGKIVVAGKFTTFSGQSLYGVARLHGDTDGSTPILPHLDVSQSSTNIVLDWTGQLILQRATNASGPYHDVPAATNPPYTIPMTLPSEFFRLRDG